MANNTLTKEEWKTLHEQIGLFRSIYLLVDGVPLTAQEGRLKNKIVVQIYLCDHVKGNWIFEDHPLRKYFYTVRSCIFKKKDLESMYKLEKKLYGKKEADRKREKYFFNHYKSIFPSFTSLKRHLSKVAESIEIINSKEYEAASKKYREETHPEYFK